MIEADFELIINIFVILLLLITLGYIWKLNRNLSILRRNQESMFSLAQTLDDASTKAANAVSGLKNAAAETADMLENVVNEAKKAKEDLSFLNEKADNLATRLESAAYAAQKAPVQNRYASNAASSNTVSAENNGEKSEAELELLKALRSIR